MPTSLWSIAFDSRALQAATRRTITATLKAAREAVAETTKEAERALEAASDGAGLGKLSRAWASKVYPRTGLSYGPRGTIYVKGGERTVGAVRAYTSGADIRSHSGKYLTIPLPAAGRGPRGTKMTPQAFEQKFGVQLRFVPAHGGHPAMLVAPGAVNSRSGRFRNATARRIASGRALDVPVFILVPLAHIGARYSIHSTFAPFAAKLERTFLAKLNAEIARLPPTP